MVGRELGRGRRRLPEEHDIDDDDDDDNVDDKEKIIWKGKGEE